MSNLKTRYRKTWAGFIWVVLNPLILFGTQCLVFKVILKIEVPRYSLFLLTGLLPWLFITQSLEMCAPILQYSGRVFKSLPIHPLVYLLAQLVDNLVNFLSAFLLVLIPLWLIHPFRAEALIALPIAVFSLLLGVAAMAWMVSLFQLFFRDTRYLLTFGIHVMFFLTPIFYPVQFVPEDYRWLVDLNFIYQLISPFRFIIYEYDAHALLAALGRSFAVSGALFGLAALVWRRSRNALYFAL